MLILSFDGLRFSGIAWNFKLLPNKDKETSVRHYRPFSSLQSFRKINVFMYYVCPEHNCKSCNLVLKT
jgi:hypothetical protein